MAEIAPFRGILYKPSPAAGNDVSALIAPPYDVISDREQKELEGKSPHNSVKLILPKDRQGGTTDERYEVAAATLSDFLQRGVMARDEQPALYRYHQIFTPPGEASAPPVVRRGFICRVRLHRFAEGVILPHERTLAGPKADRLKLKRATRTHLSQVFGLYDDPQREADAAFADLEREEPALHGKTSDGVTHRLWRLTDPAAIAVVQRVLRDRSIYIADGHHRYETMLALREELRREPGYCGASSAVEYGSIFLCNVADPGLLVFPTHRVLHSLPGFSLDALLAKLAGHFRIEEAPALRAGGAEVRKQLQQRGAAGPSVLVVSGGRAVYMALRADAELAALEHIPEGARLVSFTAIDCPFTWYTSRLGHLPALALARKRAYANDQWMLAGGQLISSRLGAPGFEQDPSQLVLASPCPWEPWRTLDAALVELPRDHGKSLHVCMR
ncbi:MAG TPA: DUF1015 domain-containing protein, partial [Pseudomonadota bacterium]|nr:DUF1015 domain-containing protein [Pseudomonadota bacterium]